MLHKAKYRPHELLRRCGCSGCFVAGRLLLLLLLLRRLRLLRLLLRLLLLLLLLLRLLRLLCTYIRRVSCSQLTKAPLAFR